MKKVLICDNKRSAQEQIDLHKAQAAVYPGIGNRALVMTADKIVLDAEKASVEEEIKYLNSVVRDDGSKIFYLVDLRTDKTVQPVDRLARRST